MLKGLLTFGLTRRPLVLLGLFLFVVAGLFAFSRLNIEAYPNPAPVILEITAQSPGQSAEEMERYFTIPIEVGLAATPGVDVIRSTSFYGLSFVRVVFQLRRRLLFRADSRPRSTCSKTSASRTMSRRRSRARASSAKSTATRWSGRRISA